MTTAYRRAAESLLAVDEMIERMYQALEAEGELDDTDLRVHQRQRVLLRRAPRERRQGAGVRRGGQGAARRAGPRVRARRDGDRPGDQRRPRARPSSRMSGATPRRVMDGRSLLDRDPDRPLLFQAEHTATTFTAVRTRAWEWVEYPNGQRELYDVVRDPYQLTSRHADPSLAAVRTQLASCSTGSARAPAPPAARPDEAPAPVPRRAGDPARRRLPAEAGDGHDRARSCPADDRLTYGAWAADMDLDGDQDLIVNDHGEQPGSGLYLNDGNGGLRKHPRVFAPYPGAGGLFLDRHDCAVADVDQNGRPDIFCSTGAGQLERPKPFPYKTNELLLQKLDGSFVNRSDVYGVEGTWSRGREVGFVERQRRRVPRSDHDGRSPHRRQPLGDRALPERRRAALRRPRRRRAHEVRADPLPRDHRLERRRLHRRRAVSSQRFGPPVPGHRTPPGSPR